MADFQRFDKNGREDGIFATVGLWLACRDTETGTEGLVFSICWSVVAVA
jgi:hypothetical protein